MLGLAAAGLQFPAALQGLPGIAASPFDLTLPLLALVLGLAAARLAVPPHQIGPQGAARGAHAGRGAAAACVSFNFNTIVTTGGGARLTDDAALGASARHLATQARENAPHDEHRSRGYNDAPPNVLASIGLANHETVLPHTLFGAMVVGLPVVAAETCRPSADHASEKDTARLTALRRRPGRAREAPPHAARRRSDRRHSWPR
jgi:hypothetical protein